MKLAHIGVIFDVFEIRHFFEGVDHLPLAIGRHATQVARGSPVKDDSSHVALEREFGFEIR